MLVEDLLLSLMELDKVTLHIIVASTVKVLAKVTSWHQSELVLLLQVSTEIIYLGRTEPILTHTRYTPTFHRLISNTVLLRHDEAGLCHSNFSSGVVMLVAPRTTSSTGGVELNS